MMSGREWYWGALEMCVLNKVIVHLTIIENSPQQMAFTRSPSLSNNPKILNNYLIFTVSDKDRKPRPECMSWLY